MTPEELRNAFVDWYENYWGKLANLAGSPCLDEFVAFKGGHAASVIETEKQRVTIERLQRENTELEKKVDRCEVGKPYSSRSRDQSHAEQIAYLQEQCGKASVIFTCDCGFQMEGPYFNSEWTCAKCRTGRLIPEPLRRIAELEQQNAALRESIELCSGSCRLPV